jgi:hypothetical protein
MQKISSVAAFNAHFPKKEDQTKKEKAKQLFRTKLHIVHRMRTALDNYHTVAQKRERIRDQLEALEALHNCATEYVNKKTGPNKTNNDNSLKHRFVIDLEAACQTLITQIHAHAQRTLLHFRAPHYSAVLPQTARHAPLRISTGVNLMPQYRFEQFTAKHGPNRRMHGGEFLSDQLQTAHDLEAMEPLDLYALVKEFKHTNRNARHLHYFDNQARTTKKLIPGHQRGLVMLNGVPADTTGNVEQMRFNDDGTVQTVHTGTFSTQSSGGDEGFAIYACDIDGDFYVHLDHSSHAGTFQHSSLLAGQAVSCAGTIYIVAGRVVMLSNNSGHYLPSAFDLHDAMVAMHADLNVDPKTVMIVCKSVSGKQYFCSGETLLTLTATDSGIEALPSNVCIGWDAEPSAVIRDFTPADLARCALAETQDQQNVVSSLRRQASAAWGARPTPSIGSARGI